MEEAAVSPPRSTRQAKDRLARAVEYYAQRRGVPVVQQCDELVTALIRSYAKKPGPKAQR